MRLASKGHCAERAQGAARGLLWLFLGVCVIAATLYDLSWIVR